jgi:hypothetical protein
VNNGQVREKFHSLNPESKRMRRHFLIRVAGAHAGVVMLAFSVLHHARLIVDRAGLRISITGFGSDSRDIEDGQEQYRREGKSAGEIFPHGLVLVNANFTTAEMNAGRSRTINALTRRKLVVNIIQTYGHHAL